MRNGMKVIIALLVMVLPLVSCSNENSTVLEEGRYPLELRIINSPASRATENSDGSATLFSDGDVIKVRVEDYNEEAEYWLTVVDGVVTDITPVENPIYWKDAKSHKVTAQYSTNGDLYNQSGGLRYELNAEAYGSFESALNLTFTTPFAKIRIIPTGNYAALEGVSPDPVYIYAETSVIGTDASETSGWVQMMRTTYGGTVCYEANVDSGTVVSQFKVGEDVVNLPTAITAPEAGKFYTATIQIRKQIDLSSSTYTISDDGTYYITGSYTNALNITDGASPTIYFENVDITVAGGSAVNITNGASPTLFMIGANSVTGGSNNNDGAGIYVSQESSVVIKGSSTADYLEATSTYNGAGIGGDGTVNVNSGAITIQNVAVTAQGQTISTSYPGIGGSASCGAITIENAEVTSIAGKGCTAIGLGNIRKDATIPKITITNSTVHAYRYDDKSNTNYIGQMASSAPDSIYYQGGEEVQLGGGSITNSKVYCYTIDAEGTMPTTHDKVYINTSDGLTISDDDTYVFTGNNGPIVVSGNSDITFDNATVNTSTSPAISIQSGSPTLRLNDTILPSNKVIDIARDASPV